MVKSDAHRTFLAPANSGQPLAEEFTDDNLVEDPFSGLHGGGHFIPHVPGPESQHRHPRTLSTKPPISSRTYGESSRLASQPPPPPDVPVRSKISDECLPLLKVGVEAIVDGNLARTTLLQRFGNTSKQVVEDARYTFPLYDGAVVVAFRCTIGDQKDLVGKVQAKDEARKQFKKAIEKQETAGLLEEHTPEIFETIVGNIPAETNISVHIEYIHEIKATILHTGEQVLELIIPMSIAPRYGGLPSSCGPDESGSIMEEDGLNIMVTVVDSKKIKNLHCNHHVTLQENVPVQSTSVSSFSELDAEEKTTSIATPLTQTIAKYSSNISIMDEDFIVSIEHHSSNSIRSRAILSPAGEDGLAALMVTLKPSEIFKGAARAEKFEGDIIFILDRSGSMGPRAPFSSRQTPTGGIPATSKMTTLVNSMLLSLASLPKTCRFNIISFGNDTEFMWDVPEPYNEASLQFAREYTRAITANFGGTNLAYAIEQVVKSIKDPGVSTQIILITDGEVEPEGALLSVWAARQKFGENIRFFGLGIGHNVPHRLINRIGELGGGYGEVVDIREKSEWADRLSLMVSAGVMPATWSCEIDLGAGFQRQSLFCSAFGPGDSLRGASCKTEIASFVQSPYPMPGLHPFTYRSIFFLLNLHLGKAPSKVILRATTNYSKDKSERVLAVENTAVDTSSIQHLAVKAVLLNMETDMHRRNYSRSQEDIGRQNAVNLGVKYAITSLWTSFLAVEASAAIVDEVELYRAIFRQGDVKHYLFPGNVWRSASAGPSQVDFGSLSTPHGGRGRGGRIAPIGARGARGAGEGRGASRLMRPLRPSSSSSLSSTPSYMLSSYPMLSENKDLEICYIPSSSHVDTTADSLLQSNGNLGSALKGQYSTEKHIGHIRANSTQPDLDDLVLEKHGAQSTKWGYVTWKEAAESQKASGIFEIDAVLRANLHSHYTLCTPAKISDSLLSMFPISKIMPAVHLQSVVDTVLVIHYFQTHLALVKDIWDMMIEKAELAVKEVLEANNTNGLAQVTCILDVGALHEHLNEYIKGKADQRYCPFLTSEMDVCVFCQKKRQLDGFGEETEDFQETNSAVFGCVDGACEFTATGQGRFLEVWRHMVSCGHVCR